MAIRAYTLGIIPVCGLRTLWTKGYEATTVEDLVAATGLSTSSLYAAFGSKHGVLQAALTRYDRDRDDLLGPLGQGTAGLDDLRGSLDRIRRGVTEPGSPGCLVNTATGVAPRDERIAGHAHRYRERVRDRPVRGPGRGTQRRERGGARHRRSAGTPDRPVGGRVRTLLTHDLHGGCFPGGWHAIPHGVAFRLLWSDDREPVLRRALWAVVAGRPPATERHGHLIPMLRGVAEMDRVLTESGPTARREVRRAAPPMYAMARVTGMRNRSEHTPTPAGR